MANRRRLQKYYAIFTIVALGVGAICFLGVVLKDDPVGRLIFGATWFLVGVLWLGQYVRAKRTSRSPTDG